MTINTFNQIVRVISSQFYLLFFFFQGQQFHAVPPAATTPHTHTHTRMNKNKKGLNQGRGCN